MQENNRPPRVVLRIERPAAGKITEVVKTRIIGERIAVGKITIDKARPR